MEQVLLEGRRRKLSEEECPDGSAELERTPLRKRSDGQFFIRSDTEDHMGIVVLTRPDGKQVAINTAQWQTITEEIGGPTGAHTQIRFSGPGSAIQVKEKSKDVLDRLTQADKDEK
jgi:hypothetical protein